MREKQKGDPAVRKITRPLSATCEEECGCESEEEKVKDPKARYYDAGGIETLDIMEAKLTKDQYIGYLLGVLLKYPCRANFKEQMKRDIEKIHFYSGELLRVL